MRRPTRRRKKTPAVSLKVLLCASGVLALTYHSITDVDLRGWGRAYHHHFQGHETVVRNLSLEKLPRLTMPHGVFLFGPDSQSVHIPEKLRFERNFTSEQLRLLEDHAIDLEFEEKRCASYGYGLPTNPRRRRLFLGSLIADDSMEVLRATSAEAYNIAHTVAFVESNFTFSRESRQLGYNLGSKRLYSLQQLYGDRTKVSVDYYVATPDEQGVNDDMFIEILQKDAIQFRWERNGMRPDDVGIYHDTDEMFTRDFLRALQICDVPQLRPNQDCKQPKIIAETLIMESSPLCITDFKLRSWYHPDASLGECIVRVGNSSLHPLAERDFHATRNGQTLPKEQDLLYNHTYGERPEAERVGDFDPERYKNGNYPLWTAHDIRIAVGGEMVGRSDGGPTAFHFHNFFENTDRLRVKYSTYGHADPAAANKPAWELQDDLKIAVKCALAEDLAVDESREVFDLPDRIRPIYYLDRKRRDRRHQKWRSIVEEEKRRYPNSTIDSSDAVEDYHYESSQNHTIASSDAVAEVPETPETDQPSPIIERAWDSSRSVVMGMATNQGLSLFQMFVTSLRATGFDGAVILGVSPNLGGDIAELLRTHNVTTKVIETAKSCTYNGYKDEKGNVLNTTESLWWDCPELYPDYKLTHARFVLYRDWLNECESCTDGVVLTDTSDSYFQRDPFATANRLGMRYPVMVFEEIDSIDNTHWLTDFPVRSCRKHTVGPTRMLCSGSTMGSRGGILSYLDAMVEEMDYWKTRDECRIDMPGDDQSIHNYLYYTGGLKDAVAIPHRTGPLHVVGVEASDIYNKNATAEAKEAGIDDLWEFEGFYVKDGDWRNWLPERYGLTEPGTGLVTNLDGRPSAQVHQENRFVSLNRQWMRMMIEKGWPYNQVNRSIDHRL